MIRRLALAAAALVALGGTAAAAQMARIPASFRGDDVYLQVSLNGGAPVWMKFDVGAATSVLAGATRPAQLSVAAGPAALERVRFRPSAVPGGLAPDGTPLAGRLGEDCLGDRVLVIRKREHEVWLSPPIDTSAVPLPAPERPARIAAYRP